MNLESFKDNKKLGIISISTLVIVVFLIIIAITGSSSPDFPVYQAERGEFVVSLTETGELRATNSVVITSPPVRGSLQIVYLAEKGEEVEEGDTLIVFDGTEWQKKIEDSESQLEIAKANLDKSEASMASNMSQLQANLESAQASYSLAELRLEQMKFEADIKKEEQELSLLQSKINLDKAKDNIEQQKTINAADLKTLELKVRQAEAELEMTNRDFDRLTILAPQPGLVVYKKIWKGGDFAEIKIGDTPWRGQALIELPDLSQMEVETAVNEVDVSRILAGQKATIVLDAFPDREFYGEVTEVSNLARIEEESVGEVKVFDVIIKVQEDDPVLKPGMTVSSMIIIETVPDVVYVPIDAIFNVQDEKIVYKGKSGFKPTGVELGVRNDNYVVILNGLEEGDYVCLVDPTKPFDSASPGGGLEDNKQKDNGSLSSTGSGKSKQRRVVVRSH